MWRRAVIRSAYLGGGGTLRAEPVALPGYPLQRTHLAPTALARRSCINGACAYGRGRRRRAVSLQGDLASRAVSTGWAKKVRPQILGHNSVKS